MSRPLLVVGEGPPPPEVSPCPEAGRLRTTPFPTIRLWQGVRALLAEDLPVVVLSQEGTGGGESDQLLRLGGAPLRWVSLPPGELGPARVREWARALEPRGIVSLGPFAPARAAAGAPEGIPTFIDLPGDLMAEAQLRGEGGAHHLALYHEVLTAALARGDAFSVCSGPQRAALWGQLGLLGRLRPGELASPEVAVIPPGVDPSWLGPAEDPLPHLPPFQDGLAWIGGMNTWLDLPRLVRLIDGALSALPHLHFIATGGGIPGHHEEAARQLAEHCRARPWASRAHLLGWLPPAQMLGALERCSVAVSLDRPTVEAQLGARTRLGLGVARRLRWVTTPVCEGARALVQAGLARPLDRAEDDVEATLEALRLGRLDPALAQAWVHAQSPEALMAPLVRWARSPALSHPPLLLGEVARQRARAAADLAEVHGSLTWRLLSRVHRRLRPRGAAPETGR